MNTTEYGELAARLESLGMKILGRAVNPLKRSDQEEVIQDSLIELTKSLEQGFVEVPEALFRVILERRAIDKARRLSARRKIEAPVGGRDELAKIEIVRAEANKTDFSAVTPNPPLSGDEYLWAMDFNQALRDLPNNLRTAFIMVELRGLTLAEAALKLGITHQGVDWRVNAAKAELRRVL